MFEKLPKSDPEPDPEGEQRRLAEVLPIRNPPALRGRVDRNERWNTGGQYGDLRGSQLDSIIQRAKRGDVADWYDLCDFILSDVDVGGLHQTRLLRVTQSDWIIAPSKRGNPRMAELAAEMVNDLVRRIKKRPGQTETLNWQQTQKCLLHAIGPGFQACEMAWEHDRRRRMYYIDTVFPRHGHRFQYDEQWNLRLYDRGLRRSPASMYGEALLPHSWIVHRHQPNAGYPGGAGQLMQIAWIWMFRRWVDKWHVGGVERGGNPAIYAKVPKNTPQPTRDQIQADLETIAHNSAGVINDDVEILAQEAAAATKSWEAYTTYKKETYDRMSANYLGASDAVMQGENGSQAAVNTRTSTAVDPRMVDDGDELSSTLQDQVFTAMLWWNRHLLGSGITLDDIPLPEMRRKTAADEAKLDTSDRVAEIQDEASAAGVAVVPGAPPVPGQPQPLVPGQQPGVDVPVGGEADVQATALNGAQVTSLKEIVQSAARGELPRESALELIIVAFPTVSRGTADRVLGPIGRGFVPSEPESAPNSSAPDALPTPPPPSPSEDNEKPETEPPKPPDEPDPKVPARATSRAEPEPTSLSRSRAMSGRLLSPFERALSSGLEGLAPSPPRRSRARRTR